MFPKFVRLVLIALIAMSLIACGTTAFASEPTATKPPTETSVPPTATPMPTITPTATPVPTATPNFKATKTAVAQATEQAQIAKIKTELEALGLPTAGSLGWFSAEPDRIGLTEYNSSYYNSIVNGKKFSNFVLKVDISWFSKSGLAGCGVIFRADSPSIEAANHYEFVTMRLAGAPAWEFEYYDKGIFTTNLSGKTQYSKNIEIANGSSNTYYLVVDGDNMSVYAKGKLLGKATSSEISTGSLAWFGFQESGETSCSFKNAWLWVLP